MKFRKGSNLKERKADKLKNFFFEKQLCGYSVF